MFHEAVTKLLTVVSPSDLEMTINIFLMVLKRENECFFEREKKQRER